MKTAQRSKGSSIPAILVALLVILMPLSAMPGVTAAGENDCAIQERINWICRQGPDSPSSCAAEWKMPVFGVELNQLVALRDQYGGAKPLKDTSYKGNNYCSAGTAKLEFKCSIQDRINWICRQSPKDAAWDCSESCWLRSRWQGSLMNSRHDLLRKAFSVRHLAFSTKQKYSNLSVTAPPAAGSGTPRSFALRRIAQLSLLESSTPQTEQQAK